MTAVEVKAPVPQLPTGTSIDNHGIQRPGYKSTQCIRYILPGMVDGVQCEVLNQSSACANSDEKTRKVRLQLSPYRDFENVRVKRNRAEASFVKPQVPKVELRKNSVKTKDELPQQQKSDERDRPKQQKDTKKNLKQSKDGSSPDVRKHSIEDNQVACQTQKTGTTPIKPKTPQQSKAPVSSKMNATQRVKRIGRIRPAATHSPVKEQDNEEDEGKEKEVRDLSGLPWHHAQLYKLYGDEADYFIHPKLEPKGNKPFSPKLKASIGHIGASDLWDTLRTESMEKLLREDMRFPRELKEAYSAFVRESLATRKKPVKRSFCVTEDVPEIDRLMDKTTLHRIHMSRHRQELMYRASKRNHCTMAVLMFNNPLPDINREDFGISRYYTSLDDNFIETPDLEYKKWISDKTKELEQKSNISLLSIKQSSLECVSKPELIVSVEVPQKPEPESEKAQLPKLQFLTEKTTVEPGQFRERFQQKKPAGLPYEYKPQTSMGFQQNRHDNMERCHSQGPEGGSMLKCTSNWEPLSMNALMEYKEKLPVGGEGEYNQGKPRLWPLSMKT